MGVGPPKSIGILLTFAMWRLLRHCMLSLSLSLRLLMLRFFCFTFSVLDFCIFLSRTVLFTLVTLTFEDLVSCDISFSFGVFCFEVFEILSILTALEAATLMPLFYCFQSQLQSPYLQPKPLYVNLS